MLGSSLMKTYKAMVDLGLVRSKRDFGRRWCGRGRTYLRDFEQRAGRDRTRVSSVTVATLRGRLCAVAARVPNTVAADVLRIVEMIDRDTAVADLMTKGR